MRVKSLIPSLIFFLMIPALSVVGQYFNTDQYPVYAGNDLGLGYSPKVSAFRIWSPVAEQTELILYAKSTGGEPLATIPMQASVQGTWVAKVERDLKGTYYAFRVKVKGQWLAEVPDPYAKAVGTNGKRAVVVDLAESNPMGWASDQLPVFSSRKNLPLGMGGLPVDAIIYELHVRDATIDPGSGVQARGKFKGLTEVATMHIGGVQTGLDHLQELGVTHVHLLPSYDFFSIDESQPNTPIQLGLRSLELQYA